MAPGPSKRGGLGFHSGRVSAHSILGWCYEHQLALRSGHGMTLGDARPQGMNRGRARFCLGHEAGKSVAIDNPCHSVISSSMSLSFVLMRSMDSRPNGK